MCQEKTAFFYFGAIKSLCVVQQFGKFPVHSVEAASPLSNDVACLQLYSDVSKLMWLPFIGVKMLQLVPLRNILY